MKDLIVQQTDDVAPIADDFLIAMADQAEKRIDAIIKVKQVALKVTNARDWTDQNGNPYLQVSGSEKIANLFNISWRIEVPNYEEEPDGNFGYSIKGIFSLGARTIEVEGTRSSKDPFFNRYEYKKDANGKEEKTVKHPSTIDKGDVKKAALTNLYGNGITRILGIRNLTWDDLYKYAGITKEMVTNKISYNQREAGGDKPPISQPKAKGGTPKEPAKEPAPGGKPEPEGPYATGEQGKRFWAIAKASGRNDDEIHVWLKDGYGINSTAKIPKTMYDKICTQIASPPEPGSNG